MLNYEVALEQLLAGVSVNLSVTQKTLKEAVGKRLAKACVANYDTPQFNNSAMDGYALYDPSGESQQFKIVGKIMAGEAVDLDLKEGEAVRIFTGAQVPQNATTVVMQEITTSTDDTLTLNKPCGLNQNIRYQGEEMRKGDVLFSEGHLLDPAAIALCASQGIYTVSVYEDLAITVFSTGDELVEPWEVLGKSQIYDANRYQLLAWLSNITTPVDGGIIKDDYTTILQSLEYAAQKNDVLILSGGASVGDADYVSRAIKELGELTAWKLAIKPGKPFGWGKIGDCLIIMLPGNPVSAYVTYYMLAYPALCKLSGKKAELPYHHATINFGKTRVEPRREFLRGTYYQDTDGRYFVDTVEFQGSAMLSGLSHANCLVEMLEDQETAKGDTVRIFPLAKESAE